MEIPDLDQERLALERRKVELDERRERADRYMRMGIVIPVAVAVLTLAGTMISARVEARSNLELQHAKARDDFRVRAAEIVMDTSTPAEAQGRALALAALFPEQLGNDFAAQYDVRRYTDPDEFQRDQRVASKKELLNILIEHPGRQSEILALWRAFFPGDDWIDELDSPPVATTSASHDESARSGQ